MLTSLAQLCLRADNGTTDKESANGAFDTARRRRLPAARRELTFLLTDEEGNPTDINDDGYHAAALKEVWYNNVFNWTTDADAASADTIDIETVPCIGERSGQSEAR